MSEIDPWRQTILAREDGSPWRMIPVVRRQNARSRVNRASRVSEGSTGRKGQSQILTGQGGGRMMQAERHELLLRMRHDAATPDRSAQPHEWLRFKVLTGIALLKLFNLFGGIWDIQWHVAIGRDSLWIPPHLLVMVAFVTGVGLVTWMMMNETRLLRSGMALEGTVRLGPVQAAPGFLGVFAGYTAALLSGGFDELWHEVFGVDVTLWSPPHVAIMLATMLVDYSLLIGLSASARRLNLKLSWDSPYFWVFVLVGAYTFEAVNFQMAQAFIVSFAARSRGLIGLLFPVLVGSLFPMSLMLILGLGRKFWIVSPILVAALSLQYAGVGIAAIGFATLRPASVVEGFVRQNPTSTIALARQFSAQLGFNGLIGFEQAWTMMLSAVPLGLVSLLGIWPWAMAHPLVAAPVYGAALVTTSSIWFHLMPGLSSFHLGLSEVLLSAVLSAGLGLLFGRIGTSLAGWESMRFGLTTEPG